MIDIAHTIANNIDISNLDISYLNISHINVDWITLAQQFKQDVMKDISVGWNNFVRTGQIWALLIGIVLGYLFRSVTAS